MTQEHDLHDLHDSPDPDHFGPVKPGDLAFFLVVAVILAAAFYFFPGGTDV